MSVILVSELTTTAAGLLAAGLWLRSARLGPIILNGESPPDFVTLAGHGDTLFDLGDAKWLWVQNAKVGRLNAWAAGFTGVATVLQLLTFWLATPNHL